MSIKYSLRENHLTAEPNDYMASVEPSRFASLPDIISRMVERGSTTTKADILAVIEDFNGALFSLIEEGSNVKLPFANYSVSIKGVFMGKTDTFDPSRHQISVNVLPGLELKNFLKSGLKVEKQETVTILPSPQEFKDITTGELNGIMTPGGMAQVLGHRLKINETDAEEGIYFVSDTAETKVTAIGHNKPSKLLFTIPAGLTSGDYNLEVRNKTGEVLKTGKLDYQLSVI